MKNYRILHSIIKYTGLVVILLIQACSFENEPGKQFELLNGERTGLSFINSPIPSQYFNAFNFMYFYNGGGLAVGDFNNDGLQDLFFTANMDSNKLFLNEGDMKFRDVTETSGMAGIDGWTTGTSVVDINNDGLLDIYVCQIGDYAVMRGKNQLYVCTGIEDGIPIFQDQASKYGLDFATFSTQASFFDYDLDGDLDMFLMNYSLHQNGTFGQRWTFMGKQHPTSGDKLLKNENGKFIDVTMESGIHSMVIGYGLGIATSDINLDGWPDIYIGNDFHENDYLYINQKDGTFQEVITDQMMHTSRFTMGVDIGDVNNDGLSDIFSLDMLPEDPVILKSSLGEDELGVFNFKLGYGYNHQYARNNLQLNNGNGTFSDIGMFAGVHATDWSWAPLLFDFDHDGYKDLFISNGIPRRMNDIDYINFRERDSDFKWKSQLDNLEEQDLIAIEQMPEIKLPNKFYRNEKNLRFKDIEELVIGSLNTYSNGSAYADLDNDGDLDIVVNNSMDDPCIYKNLAIENNTAGKNFISLNFSGTPNNINGIGSKVVVFKEKEILTYENFPVRGYQSNVQLGLNVGLGDTLEIDSIIVIWPDHKFEKLEDINFNSFITVSYNENLKKINFNSLSLPKEKPINFKDITKQTGLEFTHRENQFVEFKREPLMPHIVSIDGPALAVGDVNSDGLDDVYIGASKRRKGALFIQKEEGTFFNKSSLIMDNDSTFEDVDAVFADIENDGDLDLVIAAGGNEFWGDSEYLTQRIYINDGQGNFNSKIVFKDVYMTASCILPYDFNEDGLIDFFIGGRAVPKNYGITPDSYLIENKGNGAFENVTDTYSNDLAKIGLVKDGIWTDIDQDGDKDLVLATEWGPIKILLNNGGSFETINVSDDKGWWSFILPYDFDKDGDIDLIAGNAGENIKFKPTAKHPLKLYLKDFDNDGQLDQVLTYFLGGREIPFANYAELTKQFAFLKKKYPFSRDLAVEPLNNIFGKKNLKEAKILEATMLSSVLFENTGEDLKFVVHRLPDEIQYSSLEAGTIIKIDNGNKTNIIAGGNFYGANIEMGRSDASYGNLLTIDNNNTFAAHPLGDLIIKGQVRRMDQIKINNVMCYLIARNDEKLVVIKPEIE
ncbi:MAG: VCBS repeat-containing protein [Cyclobacteriaceae bacterium]|nr:VCBS repeat-containing protein [Cyclobacteriaceae bacterium]